MIVFLITLPGPFADWCGSLLTRLTEATDGRVAMTVWPSAAELTAYAPVGTTLDHLGRVLVESDVEHVVFLARRPDDGLLRVLSEPDARFLIAIDDPTDAVSAIIAETGEDPKQAVRAIANSCALFTQFAQLPGALLLRGDAVSDTRQALKTIEAIVGHLDIPIAPDRFRAVSEAPELHAAAARRSARSASADPAGLAAEAKMMDGALGAYSELYQGGRLGDIVWTRSLFLSVEGPSLAEPIMVAGGARIVVFGPYIHLIPGSWRAKVILGVSQEAAGTVFMIDAYGDERQLAAVTIQPAGSGLHTAELSFSVPRITQKGIELRITVMSDNAKGYLAFGNATLTPLALQFEGSAMPAGEDYRMALEL